mgnify:CR=1 FL=1
MRHSSWVRTKSDPIRLAEFQRKENDYRRKRYSEDIFYKLHRNNEARQHYQRNRERLINQVQTRYFSKTGEILTKKYQSQTAEAQKLLSEIHAKLGGKCKHCGFSDIRALQIDHKNGRGGKERRNHTNLVGYRRFVLENIEKYQLLCANCNWIKRVEEKEYRGSKYEDLPKMQ